MDIENRKFEWVAGQNGLGRAEKRGLERAFRLVAATEKGFEGFFGGVGVEEAFALVRIHVGGVEFIAGIAEVGEPLFVFGAELVFELFSEALGEGGALSGGGDGDLERATLNDGRIVEVAERGNVDDVAEDGAASGFCEDKFVEFGGGRGGDDQKHAIEVGWFEGTLVPIEGF